MSTFTFRTIDVERDFDTCLANRRDTHVESFGPDAPSDEYLAGGGHGYRDWLRERIEDWPAGCQLLLRDGVPVGQIEQRLRPEPDPGYVNLFYLVPALRGSGAADLLHDRAVATFRSAGRTRAHLNVAPGNVRAIAYYARHGWRDLGLRPGRESGPLAVRTMELCF